MNVELRAIGALMLLLLTPLGSPAAEDIRPGAYCPLPKADEVPQCLQPAQEEYGGFFDALESGELDDDLLAGVEADVASPSPTGFLALSTLSYGYYRLAQRIAADPDAHPDAVVRLERWNALLAGAFETSAEDSAYRSAVREAALDIRRRAPPIGVRCIDASGEPSQCDSTEAVLRGFNAASDRVGIRGALERLIERVTGGDDS